MSNVDLITRLRACAECEQQPLAHLLKEAADALSRESRVSEDQVQALSSAAQTLSEIDLRRSERQIDAHLWKMLEALRVATDRQALPGAFIRIMWEAGCDWINERAAQPAAHENEKPIARLLHPGPTYKGVAPDNPQARTYDEYPRESVEASNGYWVEGEQLYLGTGKSKLVLPTPEQVMHVVMKFQWEDRKNGTGTTNWAANLGMTVVNYVARLNSPKEK